MLTEIPQLTDVPEAEAHDPDVLSPAEQSELLAGHPWSKLVVIGDSIAKGVGDPSPGYLTVTWGQRVAGALASVRDDVTYANLGQIGETVADIRDSQLARAVELQPDLVAMVAGGNDVLAEEFDPARVRHVLDEIVGTLVAGGASVVTFETLDFGRIFPEFKGTHEFDELSRRLLLLYETVREIAAEHGTIHVDCRSPSWAGERYCVSADFQHPTMRCQALVASAVVRSLGAQLRKDPDQRASPRPA